MGGRGTDPVQARRAWGWSSWLLLCLALELEAFTLGLCGGRWWGFAAYSLLIFPTTYSLILAGEECG